MRRFTVFIRMHRERKCFRDYRKLVVEIFMKDSRFITFFSREATVEIKTLQILFCMYMCGNIQWYKIATTLNCFEQNRARTVFSTYHIESFVSSKGNEIFNNMEYK